jgi:hypothetical protein
MKDLPVCGGTRRAGSFSETATFGQAGARWANPTHAPGRPNKNGRKEMTDSTGDGWMGPRRRGMRAPRQDAASLVQGRTKQDQLLVVSISFGLVPGRSGTKPRLFPFVPLSTNLSFNFLRSCQLSSTAGLCKFFGGATLEIFGQWILILSLCPDDMKAAVKGHSSFESRTNTVQLSRKGYMSIYLEYDITAYVGCSYMFQ